MHFRKRTGRFRRRAPLRKRVGKGKGRRFHKARKVLTQQIIRQPTGLPDRTKVKLKLQFDVAMSNTSGGYQSTPISINDLFDPTGALGSIQPYLFDQWAALYHNYLVTGCKIRVDPAMGATGITSTSVRRYSITWSRESSLTSMSVAQVQPYTATTDLVVNLHTRALKGYMPINKLLGMTKQQYMSEPAIFGANVGNSPTRLVYCHVGSIDPYAGTTCVSNAKIMLTFYVWFYDRKAPSES